MKAIIRKICVLTALTGFGIMTGCMLIVFGGVISEISSQILLVNVIIMSVILVVFLIRELGKLKIVRLIAENQILHINTAVISDITGETSQSKDSEYTEVIISYFGILLDEKTIKFNQDGIRLRSVEIGNDFISFTYGTEKRARKIRILRPDIDQATIAEISEKFRYETGITPTLLS